MLNEEQKKLHEEAVEAAKDYRKTEARLIQLVIEVGRRKIFEKLGYPSLFKYAREALNLTEDVSCNIIRVAKASVLVPDFQKEVCAGLIPLSKARRVAVILNRENSAGWVKKAKTLTLKELDRAIAREFPKFSVPEKVTYVSDK